jgi:glucose/arabinose dehydrogenase
MRFQSIRLVGGICALSVVGQASALPPNFLDQPVATGWNQAVGLTFASDGRMFVWEKAGRVWIVENGVKAATPLIDVSEEVGDWRDYGMLGFALDPNFYSNGYIYLLYVVDYHHLQFLGTPNYDPGADWYFQDTIGRLTRYTCNSGDGFRSVNYATRQVLIGETIDTGFPICHQSHGIGSIVFGEDGTLLASCGDGASYEEVDVGGCRNGSGCNCLSDGIITGKEDVGAYRSQLVDSLSGKVVRIDPATGNGVPSNPYYDAMAPRAPRSRVWTLGLRNPFRFTLRPGTGSALPSAADPGALYLGDVGWNEWEELSVIKTGAVNLGWPAYEGMNEMWGYYFDFGDVPNEDAPNPLFGTTPQGQGLCTQQFFYFRDLIVQDTANPSPSFPNPCDPSQQVPSSVARFVHKRSALDWYHWSSWARTSAYQGNNSVVYDLGSGGSPVAGNAFGGNSSTGGAWYSSTDFPVEYQDSYYHAEFGAGWIRQILFDANDNPIEVREFMEDGTTALVAIATNPAEGGLYYIGYDQGGCCMVRRITWVNNLPPTAVAEAAPFYGPAPLNVQFTGSDSYDPDPFSGDPPDFEWDYGDGTPFGVVADPSHVYEARDDITDQGTFVGRIFGLSPPHPIGGGNWDPEVMRDGDFPPVGNNDSARQYDTYHAGDQGNLDWIGYQFAQPVQLGQLVFQEGIHFWDGGWFDILNVQALVSGVWTNVSGLTTSPSYAGNNGVNYETYRFTFNPVTATGIRITGNPGGSANFISVGELRALTAPVSAPRRYDVTLTVTDEVGAPATANLIVSVNNTPPSVLITSPLTGSTWPPDGSPIPLTAIITDNEHGPAELTCRWQTILHHNEHVHPEPYDFECTSSTVLTPVGHEGETFFYEIELQVTDGAGLSTTQTSFVFAPAEASIPAASAWAVVILGLGLASAGVIVASQRNRRQMAR